MGQHEVKTICMRDCPDACSIIATVEDGRVIRQRGDPEHAGDAGLSLCARQRLLEAPIRSGPPPLSAASHARRVGAAVVGSGTRSRCREAGAGPGHVGAEIHPGGPVLRHARLGRQSPGAAVLGEAGRRDVDPGRSEHRGAQAAQAADFGADDTHAPEDLANSRAVVVWGKNLAVTHLHWAAFVSGARKRGAKLLVIDPVSTATAKKADRHFQLRPGTDGLLALGVARRLLEREAVDTAFLAKHTAGFEAYRSLVF